MQRTAGIKGQTGMMRILFTVLMIEMVMAACSKNTPSFSNARYITISHHQTYCADPWPAALNDSLTLINVAHYLDSLNLYRASLYIKLDAEKDACSSCSCKTGKDIYVVTIDSTALLDRYLQAGFN